MASDSVGGRAVAPNEPDLDDPDNPEWTEEDFSQVTPAEDLSPEVLAAFPKTAARVRGRQKTPLKTPTSLRLDGDVLDHFKAAGPGWQGRINAALRREMERQGRA